MTAAARPAALVAPPFLFGSPYYKRSVNRMLGRPNKLRNRALSSHKVQRDPTLRLFGEATCV
jgi:hypothetical protein